MRVSVRVFRIGGILCAALVLIRACPFDSSLREYLDVHFWLPFAKQVGQFERSNVQRISAPYAGMIDTAGATPLAKLRAAYIQISHPGPVAFDAAPLIAAVAAARADASLSAQEREEVDLIDAKIDLRSGDAVKREPLLSARTKLETFLRAARTPAFLSEARGWLARVDYLLGDQTAAGKIYLDELNRDGSNLSRQTILDSLRQTYGYDGGPELILHLEDYFDTPEHAAFAIQLATNPRGDQHYEPFRGAVSPAADTARYQQVNALLEKHRDLLKSETGANALALLSMRTALRMGDPPGAVKIAAMVPSGNSVRAEPEFLWMLASGHFLSREYGQAAAPLLALFGASNSSPEQKAAAAYGLCGVYEKTGNPVEQIRFALWLHDRVRSGAVAPDPSDAALDSVYWAASGWDLGLLLDAQASIDTLQAFVKKYPNVPDVRIVRYSLAVRLARENRYGEAAQVYQAIGALRRAPRMRKLAVLYADANRTPPSPEAKYKLAEYIAANPERLYFNDLLWGGLQRYALYASRDDRLTKEEHESFTEGERKLKDDQDERWRAYLILRDVVQGEGKTEVGRKAAQLAIGCLRGINTERFGRSEEIQKADIDLRNWLR